MSKGRRFRKFLAGIISVLISCYIAIYLRFGTFRVREVILGVRATQIFIYLVLSFLITFIIYPYKVTNEKRVLLRHLKDSIIINILIVLIFTLLLYISHFGSFVSRGFTGYFFIVDTIVMFIFFRAFRSVRDHYKTAHKDRMILVTAPEDAKRAIASINKYGPIDLQLDALITIKGNTHKIQRIYYGSDFDFQLKDVNMNASDYLKREVVDGVYISSAHLLYKDVSNLMEMLDSMGIPSYLSLSNFGPSDSESRIVKMGMLNVIEYAPRIFTFEELFLKRFLDIIGGIVGCIFCGIIFIFVAPLIYKEDHGPIFFKQKRVGRNGRYFYMYKFRSMYTDAEERKKELMDQNEMDGFMFKMENDPRITKIGKFLRRTSLDEFPQFWNVLKGDMSLVGTRPPTVEEFQQYDARHKRRLSLKPGITGLWQVSGRSNITDFEEVVRLDTYYIDNWTVSSDIKILLKTVITALKGEGSE